jgi:hypothetical protein
MTKSLKVTTDSSKQEEIDFLIDCKQQVGTGSYLNDLFSPKLMTWVETQIRNDFSPDIMLNFDELVKDNGTLLTKLATRDQEIKDLQDALNKRDNEIIKIKRDNETFQTEFMREARRRFSHVYQAITGSTIHFEDDDLSGMADVCISKYFEFAKMMDDTTASLQAEIVSLKAKLYDLISK